jgi:Kef-type K+ transport system membrane component KefB
MILFALFVAAKLFARLFELLRMPGIVGEIIAGVVLGPSVLAWAAPDETIDALSQAGVLFLLFSVGLEVKPSELFKQSGTATLIATAGVLLPMAMGWGIITWWGQAQTEALFVGAAMVATRVGITARVLATKGLLHHRASQMILAAAVVDDVLGLIVLASVASLAKGGIKIHQLIETFAIVAAFLAGMAIAPRAGKRVHKSAHGATWVLVPFFLAGIGLHVELESFRSMPLIQLTAIVVFAAVVSKLVGCGLAALSLGKADAIRIGVGMIPRGEVGMVVAQIGLGLGAISRDIYSVVVFMAAATTIIAPPLLNIAFRGAATGALEEIPEIE